VRFGAQSGRAELIGSVGTGAWARKGFDRRARGGLGRLVGWLDRWFGRLVQAHRVMNSICVYIYTHTYIQFVTYMLTKFANRSEP
jgi:hypothetical protein